MIEGPGSKAYTMAALAQAKKLAAGKPVKSRSCYLTAEQPPHWQGELTAPNKLARAGWTKHTLNPGDHVTITGYALKVGKRSIWIQKLIGPDGQSLRLFEQ